jgi:hypothetical protein
MARGGSVFCGLSSARAPAQSMTSSTMAVAAILVIVPSLAVG